MTDVGLVLGGGGAKGAYEIGAWKAISQTGINNNVRICSGSSIGAINLALIQLMDIEQVSEIWLNNNLEKIFVSNGINFKEIIDIIMSIRNGGESDFEGLLSRDGLVELFDKIHLEKLENLKNDFYATVVNISESSKEVNFIKPALDWYDGRKTGITEYINLKNRDYEFIVNVLLATSAIPVVFPPVEIEERYYVDGGINDNLPIHPIYQRGYRKIIAISTERLNKNNLIKKYPLAEILLIHPSSYLGNMFNGTLNFNRQKIRQMFKLGYHDAMNGIKKSNFLNY